MNHNDLHKYLTEIEFFTNNFPIRRAAVHFMQILTNKFTNVVSHKLYVHVLYDTANRTQTFKILHTESDNERVIVRELKELFKKSSNEFAFLPIIHKDASKNRTWCHLNTLILSYNNRKIGLFEPHGSPRKNLLSYTQEFLSDIIKDKRTSFYKWTFYDLKPPKSNNIKTGLQIMGRGPESIGLCSIWNLFVVYFILTNKMSKLNTLYFYNSKKLRNEVLNFMKWFYVNDTPVDYKFEKHKGVEIIYVNRNSTFNQNSNSRGRFIVSNSNNNSTHARIE